MTSPNEKLREEITSIIYGAHWKDMKSTRDAFKPDVEAIMSLFSTSLNATLQSLIDEGPKSKTVHTAGFGYDIGMSKGWNDAIADYSKLIESKKA